MTSKTVTALAFAAGCGLAFAAMPGAQAQTYPQPSMQYSVTPQSNAGYWSARENVIESRRYDRLLETNMAFRHYRERKECGPITDSQLRGQCFASFQQYEPVMYGASTPPARHRYYRHSGY